MIDILVNTLKLTLIQITLLFGLTGLIAVALFLLQRMIFLSFFETIGWKGVYITGWIGTPIHEFGHALFCIIFRHQIKEVSLFKPDKSSGVLGYVIHTYNPKSMYQSIGNFFIGIAPLLVGSVILYLIFDTFFPNLATEGVKTKIDFDHLNSSIPNLLKEVYNKIGDNFNLISHTLLKPTFLSIVLLYIMTSISAHIAPSHTDLKNALPGFAMLVALIFFINLIFSFINLNSSVFLNSITFYLSKLHGILIFGLALTLLTFLIFYLPLFIFYLIKEKKILNPFF
jgi:hypothetical protein